MTALSAPDMPYQPTVSFVIVTYNRPARCAEAAAAAAASAGATPAEILVVNNGRTPVPLSESVSGVPCRMLQMPSNLGALARNEGWRRAGGEFVVMLDDDAVVKPGLVEAMLERFRRAPRTGAVFFRIANSRGEEEACLLPTVFHGCACGFRRCALERVGGYPPDFVYYGEEYDLSFRLYRAGYNLALCEDAPAVLHARDPAGRSLDRILKFLVRNNIFLWTAYLPWSAASDAIRDTLRWYRFVAGKERAMRGFAAGCLAAPASIWRGLRRRSPLSGNAFDKATLAGPVADACRRIRALGAKRVIFCGIGKFPTLWTKIAAGQGLLIEAFWERNTAWMGRAARGRPVWVPAGPERPAIPSDCAWLTGTASLAENSAWERQLREWDLSSRAVQVRQPVLEPVPD